MNKCAKVKLTNLSHRRYQVTERKTGRAIGTVSYSRNSRGWVYTLGARRWPDLARRHWGTRREALDRLLSAYSTSAQTD